ncbi:unnamed protein product [Chironomus riparius]|uniref:Uncharacterized protein n=1 Tax=Chironomus riparius TaxID=315576 RepID=A0A9N9X0N4_9DIPT|nr:unnamed protein product [Chironomus riparius]
MKFKVSSIFVQILLILKFSEEYNRKFLKIENSTTLGKTSIIEECQFKDTRFNFSLRIFNGSDVSNFQVNLYKVENNVAKRIARTPKFDACQFLSKRNRQNPVINAVLSVLKQFYDVAKGCPFVGTLALKNFSLNDKSYTHALGTTGIDEMLLSVSVLFQVDD